ncbi:class I SAM-dependent rRNA methyltransferase [Treponema pedis]|uniref:Putative RNA methyltransferase n=1 Tax=Treponema pedis str. T A4 TaxID=1291379 RepID=S6A0T3_9SPIR|nr:class I SAM-dependent rRNA methyltransferase [Treponema pedis]AGT44353.1 putative RNA methyltransferase [Treponema pedis str. T A4]
MHNTENFPRFKITAKGSKFLRSGHTWVYEDEIMEAEEAANGSLVNIFSDKDKYLGTGFYSKNSKIRVRIISDNKNDKFDDAFWKRRFEYAWQYRKDVMRKEDLNSCRIIFGETDGFPGLTVDKFADILVIQVLSFGLNAIKETLISILVEVLKENGQNIAGVFERNDSELRVLEGLEEGKGWLFKYTELPSSFSEVIICENGIKYSVDFINGQKTGFFLDQKYNRLAVSSLARGKRVLECFTHTGSFTLNAIAGGAEAVTAIDISASALETAKKNAALNSVLNAEEKIIFVKADVFNLLTALVENKTGTDWDTVRKNGPYDMIILDPPAFAKHRNVRDRGLKGYGEINKKAMQLLPRGGYLATASCSRFISEDDFTSMLFETAKTVNRRLRIIEKRGQSADHPVLMGQPETEYLKFFLLQVV